MVMDGDIDAHKNTTSLTNRNVFSSFHPPPAPPPPPPRHLTVNTESIRPGGQTRRCAPTSNCSLNYLFHLLCSNNIIAMVVLT